MFPLTSCRIHTTCGACVLNRDPLGCGWCRDKCLKNEECRSTWYNDSCPPFIHKVEFFTNGTDFPLEIELASHVRLSKFRSTELKKNLSSVIYDRIKLS